MKKRRQIILELIAALLIILYLYAGLSKFLDFRVFTHEMNNQPFLNSWKPWLIFVIPSSEIVIALALIPERTRLIALYASGALMLLFTAYTAAILLHQFKYIPCSCGGVIRNLTWPQHLLFNLFFLCVSVTGIILQQRKLLKSTYTTKNSFV